MHVRTATTRYQRGETGQRNSFTDSAQLPRVYSLVSKLCTRILSATPDKAPDRLNEQNKRESRKRNKGPLVFLRSNDAALYGFGRSKRGDSSSKWKVAHNCILI